MMRSLIALPVFNEERHVQDVLDEVVRYVSDVLVVDDGSTDRTCELLAARHDVRVVRHEKNRGYGAALRTAFQYAADHRFDALVTIDCDRQHEPKRIPAFLRALEECDVVSGSRYLQTFDNESAPPEDRWRINRIINSELKHQLRLNLSDSFCGFKAYRVASLASLDLIDDGYAMPLEFWVQAAHANLRIRELAVPLIYLDEERSFGGSLDQADTRLEHYRQVISQSVARLPQSSALSISPAVATGA